MSTEPLARLQAIYVDPDDESETSLGEIVVAHNGLLAVLSAHGEYADFLEDFVVTMNGKEQFNVKRPAPPDAPQYRIFGEVYDRTKSDFVEGLKAYAATHYNLKLVTEEELEKEQQ